LRSTSAIKAPDHNVAGYGANANPEPSFHFSHSCVWRPKEPGITAPGLPRNQFALVDVRSEQCGDRQSGCRIPTVGNHWFQFITSTVSWRPVPRCAIRASSRLPTGHVAIMLARRARQRQSCPRLCTIAPRRVDSLAVPLGAPLSLWAIGEKVFCVISPNADQPKFSSRWFVVHRYMVVFLSTVWRPIDLDPVLRPTMVSGGSILALRPSSAIVCSLISSHPRLIAAAVRDRPRTPEIHLAAISRKGFCAWPSGAHGRELGKTTRLVGAIAVVLDCCGLQAAGAPVRKDCFC